jgi:peptidoglycan L-alanyl-D-glutamate endopeptidase CwlK
MSRDISRAHPDLQPLIPRFLEACHQELGVEVLITCVDRSWKEQADLYALGRSQSELDMLGIKAVANPSARRVTNAKPGDSFHNFMLGDLPASLAFDCVPLRNGKPVWGTGGDGIDDNPADDLTDDLELWQRVGAIGERLGLQWAGRWVGRLREFAHFQIAKPD